ncbi:MAG TPA: RecT family recombinase [Trebonia sp.]
MTGTSSALAVREHGALAIETGQTSWTGMQEAAFGQLGIADAPEGDKGVFLHVSQRTGLDPFSKQIYMIPRWDYQAKKNKWGIQTGIEGFRVMRSRAERLEGVRGVLSRPVYYDAEGAEHKVWVQRGVPVAVEMTYTVRDSNGVETPYTSILRFDEYRQTRKDNNDNLVLTGQWATKPCHMLEKCTEADVYRKAFPQDFSGVQLDDAMPPAKDPEDMTDEELDAAARAVGYRPRVTAAQAAARRPQTVTAPVAAPDSSPAQPTPPPASAATPPQQGAGEALPPLPGEGEADPTPVPTAGTSDASTASSGRDKPDGSTIAPGDHPGSVTTDQITAIWAKLTTDYGYKNSEKDQARTVCAYVVGHDLSTTTMLSKNEASAILDRLGEWQYQAEQAGEHPRTHMTALMVAQDAEPAGE